MMKLLAQKKMTTGLTVFTDKIIFVERIENSWECFNLYCYEDYQFVCLYETPIYRWEVLDNYLVFQEGEGTTLHILNTKFKLKKSISGGWYISGNPSYIDRRV